MGKVTWKRFQHTGRDQPYPMQQVQEEADPGNETHCHSHPQLPKKHFYEHILEEPAFSGGTW